MSKSDASFRVGTRGRGAERVSYFCGEEGHLRSWGGGGSWCVPSTKTKPIHW